MSVRMSERVASTAAAMTTAAAVSRRLGYYFILCSRRATDRTQQIRHTHHAHYMHVQITYHTRTHMLLLYVGISCWCTLYRWSTVQYKALLLWAINNIGWVLLSHANRYSYAACLVFLVVAFCTPTNNGMFTTNNKNTDEHFWLRSCWPLAQFLLKYADTHTAKMRQRTTTAHHWGVKSASTALCFPIDTHMNCLVINIGGHPMRVRMVAWANEHTQCAAQIAHVRHEI